MQSGDIRLVPSRIEFGDKQSTFNQAIDGSNLLSNTYDANVDMSSFDLALGQTEIELLSSTANLNLDGSTQHDEYHLNQAVSTNTVQDDDSDEEDDEEEEESQLPSATADAMETYTNITENIYCGSATGKSIAEESMPCECKYRPDIDNPDAACGDDNYCINRMMFMECMVDDCPCERYCRNRRFQLRQYARVDVIRTDKKGFGLRALTDLPTNAFIMEYIGEVIPNHEFIRRTKEYESAGLEHYYFMTLKTDEIIDATKKGCLARFINHSCNPNSVTQKWVVGKNMRIGIFTRRPIKAGQELTFDYKFERYGAVAQPCFCGEAVCKGFIGGSLKSDNAKAPTDTSILENDLEDDDDDDEEDENDSKEDSDTAEAVTLTQKKMLRKMHRRRASEPLQDPREVQSFVKRMLDSVGKSHLVLKLLLRLELTDKTSAFGKDILRKFVRLHGLKMLKFWLSEWKNDTEILVKVLHVLSQLPLANKNGLEDCKMFEIVGKLTDHEDEEISTLADQLLRDWDKLKSVYRIPKRIPTEKPAKEKSHDEDALSEVSADIIVPPRFDSSREFFDPDDDYFEYLSMDSDYADIQWKIEYPPRSTIPTAPRAMIDACVKNGFYGYGGRPRMLAQTSYPTYPVANETNTGSDTYSDPDDRAHSSYSSPYKSDYKSSRLNESYNYNAPSSSNNNNSATYFDSPHHTDSPTTSIAATPTGPLAMQQKLPNNWKFAHAEDGTIYYYHRISGKTQWNMPEERVSSIEGVNQSDLEDLVEKTIQDAEKRKLETVRSASPAVSIGTMKASPRIITPSVSRRGSHDNGSTANTNNAETAELKKEVGKVVTKYLSSKQKNLWNGDKYLFKELARKITHHIVDREVQSSRKIHTMNTSVRTKIEKFIDSHGAELVNKVNRKRKHPSSFISKDKMHSPSSVVSEDVINKVTPQSTPSSLQPLPTPQSQPPSDEPSHIEWNYDQDVIPTSPAAKRRALSIQSEEENQLEERRVENIYTKPETMNDIKPALSHTNNKEDDYYYSRRSRADSPSYRSESSSRDKLYGESSREYVRPGYVRSYNTPYYRYPPPSSSAPYYRGGGNSSRYYSSSSSSRRPSPPPYYLRPSASSSRRGSLSDDDMDRRRWD